MIGKVCQQHDNFQPSTRDFSAAEYLYVSHHVARAHQNLLESMLVLNYRSATVANNLLLKWKAQAMEKKAGTTRVLSVSTQSGVALTLPMLVNYLLMVIGSQPAHLQEVIVGISNPIFIGTIAFLGNTIFKSALIGIPVVASVAFFMMVFILYVTKSHDHHEDSLSKVLPISANGKAIAISDSRRLVDSPAAGAAGAGIAAPLPPQEQPEKDSRNEVMDVFEGAKAFLARLDLDDELYADASEDTNELLPAEPISPFLDMMDGAKRWLGKVDDINSDSLEDLNALAALGGLGGHSSSEEAPWAIELEAAAGLQGDRISDGKGVGGGGGNDDDDVEVDYDYDDDCYGDGEGDARGYYNDPNAEADYEKDELDGDDGREGNGGSGSGGSRSESGAGGGGDINVESAITTCRAGGDKYFCNIDRQKEEDFDGDLVDEDYGDHIIDLDVGDDDVDADADADADDDIGDGCDPDDVVHSSNADSASRQSSSDNAKDNDSTFDLADDVVGHESAAAPARQSKA